MWLVRVLPGSEVKAWHKSAEADYEDLAGRAFRIDLERPEEEQRVSTYLARDAAQEALAVAAHYQTFGRKNLQDTWALRICLDQGLLSRLWKATPAQGRGEAGVGFDSQEPGQTGVAQPPEGPPTPAMSSGRRLRDLRRRIPPGSRPTCRWRRSRRRPALAPTR